MTMLAAWAGVDSRSGASIYIATDSKLTDASGRVDWSARKIHVCQTHPHIFGYAGWSSYPTHALRALVEQIDQQSFFIPGESATHRQQKVLAFLQMRLRAFLDPTAWETRPRPFVIIHAMREHSRMASVFRLWEIQWVPTTGWLQREQSVRGKSAVLSSQGSGKQYFRPRLAAWNQSEVKETSRAVFSAFCESLRATRDLATGGAPLLAGLYRVSAGQEFGVVYRERPFLASIAMQRGSDLRRRPWRNELFERVNSQTLMRKLNAQPQPRPRRISRPRKPKPLFS